MDDLDAHAYDEVRYEEQRERVSGLCEVCHDNAAIPGDDWCADCIAEVELDQIEQGEAA